MNLAVMLPVIAVRQLVGLQIQRLYSTARGGGGTVNIFDRKTKRQQRNRVSLSPDASTYDYLRDRVAETVADRVSDISRFFPLALDIGCGRGHVAVNMAEDLISSLYQCDMAKYAVHSSRIAPEEVITQKLVIDEEGRLPFRNETFDLAVSSLSLHWVNDLPGVLREVFRVLKADAPLIGVMFAGDTLFELRCSLQLAEMERYSGFFPHVSPFVQLRDMGGLLGQAGYSLTTIDIDEIIVNFPSMFELMKDLQGMGESNCAWSRPLTLRREAMKAAAAIYKEMYGNKEEDSVPATFQLLYFIGWKPHHSQAKPLPRGSATASFKDISNST